MRRLEAARSDFIRKSSGSETLSHVGEGPSRSSAPASGSPAAPISRDTLGCMWSSGEHSLLARRGVSGASSRRRFGGAQKEIRHCSSAAPTREGDGARPMSTPRSLAHGPRGSAWRHHDPRGSTRRGDRRHGTSAMAARRRRAPARTGIALAGQLRIAAATAPPPPPPASAAWPPRPASELLPPRPRHRPGGGRRSPEAAPPAVRVCLSQQPGAWRGREAAGQDRPAPSRIPAEARRSLRLPRPPGDERRQISHTPGGPCGRWRRECVQEARLPGREGAREGERGKRQRS